MSLVLVDHWKPSADSHKIRGIKVVTEKDFRHLRTQYEVKRNRYYLLLYATYSSGDSFETAYNSEIDFIDLFDGDYERAAENKNRILRSHRGKNLGGVSREPISLMHHSGEEYLYSPPWGGPHERLEHVEIEHAPVVDIYPEL